MTKTYFPHDSNARNSKKLLRLRKKHGAAGYGVYFMLIERLTEEENFCSDLDYDMLAFELRVKRELVKSVVENFELFDVKKSEGGVSKFTSAGLTERMEIRGIRSEAGKKGAAARWNTSPQLTLTGFENENNAMAKNGKMIAEKDIVTGTPIANSAVVNSIKEKNIKDIINNNPFFYVFPFFSVPNVKHVDLATLAYLVLERNIPNAEKELEQMIAYNEVQGRIWKDMKVEQRMAAAKLWHPRSGKEDKFSNDFRAFWYFIVKEASETIVFEEKKWLIVYHMLADSVTSAIKQQDLTLEIRVSSDVYEWMEGAAPVLREKVRNILSILGLEHLEYVLTDKKE